MSGAYHQLVQMVRPTTVKETIVFGVVEIAPGNRQLRTLVAKPEFPYACCKV
jgi:hypothetical protein